MSSDYLEAEAQRMLQDHETFKVLQSLRSALQDQKDFNSTLKGQLKRATDVQLKLEITLNEMEAQLQLQFDRIIAIRKRMLSKHVENATVVSGTLHTEQQCAERSNGGIQEISPDDQVQVTLPDYMRLPSDQAMQVDSSLSPPNEQNLLDRKRKNGASEPNASESKTACNPRNEPTESDAEIVIENHQMEKVSPRPRDTNAVNNTEPSTKQLDDAARLNKCQIRLSRVSEANLKNVARRRRKCKESEKLHCTFCGKAFICSSHLFTHLRIHTVGGALTLKDKLAIHRSIHTGERPFKCPICNAAFSRKYHLSRHSSIHTDKKRFTCADCKVSFRRKEHLSDHLSFHRALDRFTNATREKEVLAVNAASHTEVGVQPMAGN